MERVHGVIDSLYDLDFGCKVLLHVPHGRRPGCLMKAECFGRGFSPPIGDAGFCELRDLSDQFGSPRLDPVAEL
jgi:hypothetical protein